MLAGEIHPFICVFHVPHSIGREALSGVFVVCFVCFKALSHKLFCVCFCLGGSCRMVILLVLSRE